MSIMPTIEELRRTLRKNPGVTQIDSVDSCGQINSMLQLDLEEDYGISSELVTTYFNVEEGRIGHMYLKLSPENIDGADGTIIVDGALDQFTKANLEKGLVKLALGSENEIPELVIATPSDRMYQYYTDDIPVDQLLT